MSGKSTAVASGRELQDKVKDIGTSLNLIVDCEVYVGRRLWGVKRRIDVVFKDSKSHISLGVECKYQAVRGTAEEKIAATLEDIKVWPIRGLVVFDGEGFSPNMRSFLLSTGMAVELIDLKEWLKLYFGL